MAVATRTPCKASRCEEPAAGWCWELGSREELVWVMVRGSGWLEKSYTSVLWGSRGRDDVYKVPGYFPGTIDDTDKELN